MKKNILFILVFAFLTTTAFSQVVINEIMYNPPESGSDSLEYIELFNIGPNMEDLTGYTLGGVEYTFPEFSLEPGGYAVIAINSEALMNNFGVASAQWTSGALKNGGEVVSLINNLGIAVDEVDYMNAGAWPGSAEGTAGEGGSIELCDPATDNNIGTNWGVSSNNTGVVINGKDLKGTPGAANTACGPPVPDYIVQTEGFTFNPADITIGVGETVEWQNTGGTHNVNGSTDVFPDNPEGFSSGDPSGELWTFQYTFNQAGIYNYQCDPHAGFGMTGTVTVISDEIPNEYPLRSISEMVSLDGNGVGDSLSATCELIGVVHGPNLRSGGLTFVILDGTNEGITVFKNSENLGYTVTEGDEVSVKGVITQFSGLLEIEPDSLTVLSSGNMLFDPTDVTSLGEDTESQLVKMSDMTIVDQNDWFGDGGDFNVRISDGSDEFIMRIDADTELANMMLPGLNFNVTGLGGQYDTDSPYDEGYQLFPRYASDIQVISSTFDQNYTEYSVYPNPVQDVLNIDGVENFSHLVILDMKGRIIQTNALNGNQIDISMLPSGVYTVMIFDNTEIAGYARIIKQ
jgi:plastocyanin/DNA/RNA endonuclease YhcR with UshA esterase domain